MKNEKIKIEIDLLRDSLKNLFIVIFAIISGEISLFYKLVKKIDFIDLFMFVIGIFVVLLLFKIKKVKEKEIDDLLLKMEE